MSINSNRITRYSPLIHYVALGAILLIAIALHFYRLDQEGFANLYYAATVKSMLTSAHNFFFASFDPGGFVSVDKPPLGFWIQAVSAALFGFSGFSLLLPEAMAGVLSVALLYVLVRRVFGATAGLIAALALAVTPISIAANRNNTVDSLLVFTLLLAAWAISLATEKGKLGWLTIGLVLVGIGFNIKMLQAFMVLPAFYFVYLVAARTTWWKRIVHLSLATIPLVVVSFAWVVLVDLTPPDDRPFVGSSANNTEMELIVGHNGVARLGAIANLIGVRGPGGEPRRPDAPLAQNQPGQPPRLPQGQPGAPRNAPPGYPQPPQNFPPRSQPARPPGNQPAQPPTGPRGPIDETGDPGPFRLFNKQLAGQISWLLPLAVIGLIAAALATRLQYPFAREHQALILWGMWLAPMVVFFNWAGLFHRYYLEMLSPAIAALVSAGFVAMWRIYAEHRGRGLILPFALLISAVTQAAILLYFADWIGWLIPAILIASAIIAFALAILRIAKTPASNLHRAVVAIGILILLVAPTVWAITPVIGSDVGLPFAGPELLTRTNRSPILPNNAALINYLRANRAGAEFLAATVNANSAAPIILATGEPVMSVGGFGGNDKILTTDQLAQFVEENIVRFFLLSPQGNQQELERWVTDHCANVSRAVRQSQNFAPPNSPNPSPGAAPQLYDCAPK